MPAPVETRSDALYEAAVRRLPRRQHALHRLRDAEPGRLLPATWGFTRLLRDEMRCRVILLLVDDLRAGLRGLGVTVNGRGSLRAALA